MLVGIRDGLCSIDTGPEHGLGPRQFAHNHGSMFLFHSQIATAVAKETRLGQLVEWPRGGHADPWLIMPIGANPKFARYEDEQLYDAALKRHGRALAELSRAEYEAARSGRSFHFEPRPAHEWGFPEPISVRLLWDARFGVNDRGPKRPVSADTFRSFLAGIPAGAYLWGVDLVGAFRLGEVVAEERVMLGICFGGRRFVYTRLPFGARESPIEYTTYFGRPIHHFLAFEIRRLGLKGIVFVWVDDFFGWAATEADATLQQQCFRRICDELGVEWARDKTKPVAQSNVLMGYIVSTVPVVSVAIEERKLAKLRAVVAEVLRCQRTVPFVLLQKLMGCVEHMALGISGARPFSAEILRHMRGAPHVGAARALVPVPSSWHSDLRFFAEEADRWNGVEEPSVGLAFPPLDEHATCDAAGEGCLAVAVFGVVIAWPMDRLAGEAIQLKELVAAVMLQIILASLMGQPAKARANGAPGHETRVWVPFRSDNTNVLSWLFKGRTTSELGNRLMRQLWRVLVRTRMRFESSYIKSADNGLADAGSRLDAARWATAHARFCDSLPSDRPAWWPAWADFPPVGQGIVDGARCAQLGTLPQRLCAWDAGEELSGVEQVDELLHDVGTATRALLAAVRDGRAPICGVHDV